MHIGRAPAVPGRAGFVVAGRRLAAVVAAVVVVGSTGACGVPLQRTAQPLPSGALPVTVAPVVPSPLGRTMTMYFVSGRTLAAVKEIVVDRSANGIMAVLAAGPPPDRAAELRTLLLDPLTGAPMLGVTGISPTGQVTFVSQPAFAQLPASDQILLLGQVTLSMEEIGMSSITVTDTAGAPLSMPLPDGRALIGPATANDYRTLVG
jgi:hypothetical protein